MHPEDVAPIGIEPASECIPRSPTWEDQVLSHAGPRPWHQDNGSSDHSGFPHCFIPVLCFCGPEAILPLCVCVFTWFSPFCPKILSVHLYPNFLLRRTPVVGLGPSNSNTHTCFSHVQRLATPRTVACQAPLSMGFSRQEYWSWCPCPLPGDRPNPGIKLLSLMSPALAGSFFTTSASWEACTPLQPYLKLDYICKDPVSKSSHIHRYWGLGHQHLFWGTQTHNSPLRTNI